MKKSKISLLLLILSLFFVFSSVCISAEERSIYVGDLIQLKIESQNLTLDEITDKFKDFEIVNVSDITNGYLLTLRSFETGEKTVQIGDKEIKIVIKSTLSEIERKEVYEGNLNPQGTGFYLQWKYILFALIGIFLLTGGLNIWLFLKKRKDSSLKPHQRFINSISDLSIDQDDYLVKLTVCFKEYIEATYSFHIKGKTSTEIINEISRMPGLNEKIPEIKSWLQESDYYKFSGTAVPMAKKLELMGNLQELVGRIEETKEGEIR
ncbi:hypothetical protein [Acetivibrio cellulolyticus]|uniref:hypothetical protein n=1 Tax=Acetivibrio cellulolyticus TaxID=35830 RepID=UPI0001E2F5B9|nr:hypothetical protein [Acetivibrio cellulolyticus]